MAILTSAGGGRAALLEALTAIPAVDHHAHYLVRPQGGVFELGDDAAPLNELTLESNDPVEARRHIREHPSYTRAIRDLAELLGVEADEKQVASARAAEGFDAYCSRLLGAANLDEMFVDDGLQPSGSLTMEEQEKIAGCPIRPILRIETTVQRVAEGWPAFDAVRDGFRAEIETARAEGLVALKTIAAYRCGLDLPSPSLEDAAGAYERWSASGSSRLVEPALVSFFVFEALDAVRDEPLPLQVHTGVVGTDTDLRRADPSLLRSFLEHPDAARVPVVLLHSYPFVAEASWLAAMFPNVYVDLSILLTFVSHRGVELVRGAMDLAPATKLLFATDGFRVPELFYLGAKWWREALAGALSGFVEDGVTNEATALRWGGLILAGNARRLYEGIE